MIPGYNPPARKSGLETVSKIKRAYKELFGTEFTTKDVADRAEIPAPTIYKWFSDGKDTLFQVIREEEKDRLETYLERWPVPREGLIDAVLAFRSQFRDFLEYQPDASAYLFSPKVADYEGEGIKNLLLRVMESYRVGVQRYYMAMFLAALVVMEVKQIPPYERDALLESQYTKVITLYLTETRQTVESR